MMKSLFSLLLLFIIIVAITGCSWDRNDPRQSWYYPQAGSKLILHQRLTIKPDTAALFIQQGKITGSKHSRFDPYCKIRVRNVANTVTYINPDIFTILRSGRHTELVAGLDSGFSGVMIPLERGSKASIRFNISSSDAPSDIPETIFMSLASSKQPEVISLVCGGVEDHLASTPST